MPEYLEFARSHPLLVFGFLGVLGFIIWSEFNRLNRKYKQLGVNEAVRLLNDDNVFCIDVREDKELDGGIIKGARHIPVSQLNTHLNELEKHKNNPVLVYCRSGSRSAHACNTLTKQGFEDVSNLAGGIIAWESANLPLAKR
jgi:rhodanese-related sulfurtransferase